MAWCPTVAKLLDEGDFDLYACREVSGLLQPICYIFMIAIRTGTGQG